MKRRHNKQSIAVAATGALVILSYIFFAVLMGRSAASGLLAYIVLAVGALTYLCSGTLKTAFEPDDGKISPDLKRKLLMVSNVSLALFMVSLGLLFYQLYFDTIELVSATDFRVFGFLGVVIGFAGMQVADYIYGDRTS